MTPGSEVRTVPPGRLDPEESLDPRASKATMDFPVKPELRDPRAKQDPLAPREKEERPDLQENPEKLEPLAKPGYQGVEVPQATGVFRAHLVNWGSLGVQDLKDQQDRPDRQDPLGSQGLRVSRALWVKQVVKGDQVLLELRAFPVTLATRDHVAKTAFRELRVPMDRPDLKASEESPESPEFREKQDPKDRSVPMGGAACQAGEEPTASPVNKENPGRKDPLGHLVPPEDPEPPVTTENPDNKGQLARKVPLENSDFPELRVFPDCKELPGLLAPPDLLVTVESEEKLAQKDRGDQVD